MPSEDTPRLPAWAPRLRREQIRRFYETCSAGIVDAEIIDDVGYSLYARCESMLEVKEAKNGRVRCPACGETVLRTCMHQADELLVCGRCGWVCSWRAYRDSYKGQSLNPGRVLTMIIDFVKGFRVAKTFGERIVLIDTLIHSIHGELAGGHKPAAYNFIEGPIEDVAAFLDRLSYGEDVPEDITARRDRWRQQIRSGPRFWSEQMGDRRE